MSPLPPHKVITEGPNLASGRKLVVLVDAFDQSNSLPDEYFENHDVLHVLTHAHADHYTGLQHARWSAPGGRGKVLCNAVTATLVEAIVGLPRDILRVVDMDQPVAVHPSVTLTLIDANHCPGACMALLEFASGRRVLHTGDFRYSRSFQSDAQYAPLQHAVNKGLDDVFLDTTYCHPRHDVIPDRDAALEELGRAFDARNTGQDEASLHLIATYTIGKERVIEEIARRLGTPIVVDAQKQALLQLSGRDMALYSTDAGPTTPPTTSARVVKWGTLGETWPYFRPNYTAPAELANSLGYKKVVGWVPTGWVSASQQRSFSKSLLGVDVEIVLVPYSEHSSFAELKEFVGWVKPKHVVPTVGADDEKATSKLLKHFRHLVDGQASKQAFISKMTRARNGLGEADEADEADEVDEAENGEPEGEGDVIELLDDADDASTATDTASGTDDDVVIIEETTSRKKKTAKKQASIKRYGTFSVASPSPQKRNKEETPKKKTPAAPPLHPPVSPRVPFSFSIASPTKAGAVEMISRPLLQKASAAEYDPKSVEDRGFKGVVTPYAFLAEAMQLMELDSSRLAKEQILVNVFRTILATSESDLQPSIYMLLGRVADEQDGIELNIGGATLNRCLSEAVGVSVDRIKKTYREVGDLGTVASTLKGAQTVLMAPQPKSVAFVFGVFREIAATTGKGSHQTKRKLITKVLRCCTSAAETKFVVRGFLGNMRIGANWRSIFLALGKAMAIHRCDARDLVPTDDELNDAANRVCANYCRCPSVSRCCTAELAGDERATLGLTLHVPFKPMLAKPAGKGVSDAVETIGKQFASDVLVEHKYDGMRALIHIDVPSRKITVFSRNAENRTDTFGDDLLVPLLQALSGVEDAIFDAEVVALAADGSIDSFQKLAAKASNNCSVGVKIFDLLHVNGESLLDTPLAQRRERLTEVVKPNNTSRVIGFAASTVVSVAELTPESLREMLVAALASKSEGLMLKDLSRRYECMQRTSSWLKLKKDYCEDDASLADSIDVRVIGAWWGNGRKAGWYSPFLVAVYDDDTETWQSLCRVMSGFSDVFYKSATERLGKKVVEDKPFEYETGETPPVWFDSDEVWEIRGADLQLSPVHRVGMGIVDEARGLGLRFPRFVGLRDDKTLDDVTRAEDVAALF